MMQLLLALDPPKLKTMSLQKMVEQVMLEAQLRGTWLASFEVQQIVDRRWSEWHTDSTISARMRQLRGSKKFPQYVLDRRKRAGTESTYEYLITGRQM